MCPRGHEHAPSRFEHTSAFRQPGVLVGHVLTRFHRPGKSRPACQQKMRIHGQRGGEKKREREGKRERERDVCVRAHTRTQTYTWARRNTHRYFENACQRRVHGGYRPQKIKGVVFKGEIQSVGHSEIGGVLQVGLCTTCRGVGTLHGAERYASNLGACAKKARVLSGLAAMKRPANSVSTYQDTCGPCGVNCLRHRTQRPRSASALSLAPTPRDDPPCLSAPARLSSPARVRACVTHTEVATGQENASHGSRSARALRPVTSSPASP